MDLHEPPVLQTGDEGPFRVSGDEAEYVNDSSSKPPSPHWPEWLDGLGSETGYSPSVAAEPCKDKTVFDAGYDCERELSRNLQRL